MKKIAVLVSGGGTNLQALIDDGIEISLVISSKKDVYALTRAVENGIPTETVEWSHYKPDRVTFSRDILKILEYNNIDLVVYAGFLVILDDCVCDAFPNAMLNVHPSLIPAFCGVTRYVKLINDMNVYVRSLIFIEFSITTSCFWRLFSTS